MDLIIESFPRLLNATKLTIELTLVSLIFGIFVGGFFSILRISNNKLLYYYFVLLFLYFQRHTSFSANFYNIFWIRTGRVD